MIEEKLSILVSYIEQLDRPRYSMNSYEFNKNRNMNHFGEYSIRIARPEINNRINKKGYDPILESDEGRGN